MAYLHIILFAAQKIASANSQKHLKNRNHEQKTEFTKLSSELSLGLSAFYEIFTRIVSVWLQRLSHPHPKV